MIIGVFPRGSVNDDIAFAKSSSTSGVFVLPVSSCNKDLAAWFLVPALCKHGILFLMNGAGDTPIARWHAPQLRSSSEHRDPYKWRFYIPSNMVVVRQQPKLLTKALDVLYHCSALPDPVSLVKNLSVFFILSGYFCFKAHPRCSWHASVLRAKCILRPGKVNTGACTILSCSVANESWSSCIRV